MVIKFNFSPGAIISCRLVKKYPRNKTKIPQDFELLIKVPESSHQNGSFGRNQYIGTLFWPKVPYCAMCIVSCVFKLCFSVNVKIKPFGQNPRIVAHHIWHKHLDPNNPHTDTILKHSMRPWCLSRAEKIFRRREMWAFLLNRLSKHLKGQLDPPVGNGNVFAPREFSWTPLLARVKFLHQRRSVGPRCW